MKISLTGATGFLGKVIYQQLTEQGHSVTTWGRNPTQKTERAFNLEHANSIDLNDTDILIHNAAYLPKSYEDPSEATNCLLYNGIATLELLQAAEKAHLQKFVYISSGTIYDPAIWKATEKDRIYPSMRATYYLTSKMVGDVFTSHFGSKMKTVILRPSSIYGPGMKPRGLVPRLTQKLMNNEMLTQQDVGNYTIDLVHVADVAWMAVQAATHPNIVGAFNVGGGLEVTTPVVAQTLAKILNKSILTDFGESSNGHAILDIRSAQEFGYQPIELEAGLRSYVESL